MLLADAEGVNIAPYMLGLIATALTLLGTWLMTWGSTKSKISDLVKHVDVLADEVRKVGDKLSKSEKDIARLEADIDRVDAMRSSSEKRIAQVYEEYVTHRNRVRSDMVVEIGKIQRSITEELRDLRRDVRGVRTPRGRGDDRDDD